MQQIFLYGTNGGTPGTSSGGGGGGIDARWQAPTQMIANRAPSLTGYTTTFRDTTRNSALSRGTQRYVDPSVATSGTGSLASPLKTLPATIGSAYNNYGFLLATKASCGVAHGGSYTITGATGITVSCYDTDTGLEVLTQDLDPQDIASLGGFISDADRASKYAEVDTAFVPNPTTPANGPIQFNVTGGSSDIIIRGVYGHGYGNGFVAAQASSAVRVEDCVGGYTTNLSSIYPSSTNVGAVNGNVFLARSTGTVEVARGWIDSNCNDFTTIGSATGESNSGARMFLTQLGGHTNRGSTDRGSIHVDGTQAQPSLSISGSIRWQYVTMQFKQFRTSSADSTGYQGKTVITQSPVASGAPTHVFRYNTIITDVGGLYVSSGGVMAATSNAWIYLPINVTPGTVAEATGPHFTNTGSGTINETNSVHVTAVGAYRMAQNTAQITSRTNVTYTGDFR